MTEERIRYAEAAIIALSDAAQWQETFSPDQQLARAQAFATLAAVEQARIANLIAWKALRQSASPSTLPGSGDAITQEIEAALGITDPPAPEQTEWWSVIGGIGGQRIYQDLPSRAAAEERARIFAARMAREDVPQTRTWVEQQPRRYGKADA